MFVFFTIPWIFVAVAILFAVAAGVSVLQFIVDHIIVISVVLAVLIVFLVRAIWKDKEDAEENKVEITLCLFSLVPSCAALFRLIMAVLDALGNDLFAFGLYIFAAPVEAIIALGVCLGIVTGLSWLHQKFIRSKWVVLSMGALIMLALTVFFWNANW